MIHFPIFLSLQEVSALTGLTSEEILDKDKKVIMKDTPEARLFDWLNNLL